MLQTRTNIAPPFAAGRKALGALRRGLPRMRSAVEGWLRRTRQRPEPILLDGGLMRKGGPPTDQTNNQRLMPIRLPRQF